MNQDNQKTADKIKILLAEMLGVDPEDISDEDSLIDDLHMKPTDLSDLLKTLEESGINTTNLDLTEVDTFSDLVENLTNNEVLE